MLVLTHLGRKFPTATLKVCSSLCLALSSSFQYDAATFQLILVISFRDETKKEWMCSVFLRFLAEDIAALYRSDEKAESIGLSSSFKVANRGLMTNMS